MTHIIECNKCHHEWQSTSEHDLKCSWCGFQGKVISSEKSFDPYKLLERMKK